MAGAASGPGGLEQRVEKRLGGPWAWEISDEESTAIPHLCLVWQWENRIAQFLCPGPTPSQELPGGSVTAVERQAQKSLLSIKTMWEEQPDTAAEGVSVVSSGFPSSCGEGEARESGV